MRRLSIHTLLLLAAIMVASIAAMPATLAKPAAPTASATGNPGEMTISWDRVQGAQYYTVGWINWTQGQRLYDADQDWQSLFHYTTVVGSRTSYTVSGLSGGDNHHSIIRATDEAGGRFGGGYSEWSDWSSAVQPASLPPPPAPGDANTVTLSRPSTAPDCRVGQRLSAGQSCKLILGSADVDRFFSVHSGGSLDRAAVVWVAFGDITVLWPWPNRGWSHSEGDQRFRIQFDNEAWVIRELG